MAGTFYVILACLCWAIDTLIRYPLVDRGISPVTIVFYEHILLVIFFSIGLISSIKRMGEVKLADLFSFLVIGGLGSAIATVAFTDAFQYLNPSLVILLQKLQPIVAIILASIVLKETIQKQFIIWATVCLTGGFLVSSPDIGRLYDLLASDLHSVTTDAALQGYSLVAISVICWGAATVFGKKLSLAGYEPKTIMSGRFLTGLLVLLPFVEWNQSLILPRKFDYAKILVMVIISGALAMWFYYQGLKRLSAKTTAVAEMFFPFFAIIVNWVFLGKQLTELQLFGGVLLIIGSLVIQLKKY